MSSFNWRESLAQSTWYPYSFALRSLALHAQNRISIATISLWVIRFPSVFACTCTSYSRYSLVLFASIEVHCFDKLIINCIYLFLHSLVRFNNLGTDSLLISTFILWAHIVRIVGMEEWMSFPETTIKLSWFMRWLLNRKGRWTWSHLMKGLCHYC